MGKQADKQADKQAGDAAGGTPGTITVLQPGPNRPIQKRRVSRRSDAAIRHDFLNHLAATCNVRAASAAAGTSWTVLYGQRRADPAFAEQWRQALLIGYERLEAELLRKAIATLDEEAIPDPDRVIAGPMSVEQAIKLLHHHRTMQKAGTSSGRGPHGQATQAETDAVLMARLKVIHRQRDAGA